MMISNRKEIFGPHGLYKLFQCFKGTCKWVSASISAVITSGLYYTSHSVLTVYFISKLTIFFAVRDVSYTTKLTNL